MIRLDNQCQGKHPYPTKESANITATHLNKLGGRRLNSYKCGVCSMYHIGHNSKGKKLQPHDNGKKAKNKITDFDHEPTIHIGDKRFLK
jgi:hypothetical protein